jgi:hypothetical protein
MIKISGNGQSKTNINGEWHEAQFAQPMPKPMDLDSRGINPSSGGPMGPDTTALPPLQGCTVSLIGNNLNIECEMSSISLSLNPQQVQQMTNELQQATHDPTTGPSGHGAGPGFNGSIVP